METNVPVPTFVMFDMEGNVIKSWGDPDVVPRAVHGCSFDSEDNVWVAGNQDAIVQKYSHDGELLMQIGTKMQFDTEDGTRETEFRNSSQELLHRPSGAVADPETGDIFISDGYGNKRVVVFDAEGNYLRQWGSLATEEEREAGTPGTFTAVVHCIEMSNAGPHLRLRPAGQSRAGIRPVGQSRPRHPGRDRELQFTGDRLVGRFLAR